MASVDGTNTAKSDCPIGAKQCTRARLLRFLLAFRSVALGPSVGLPDMTTLADFAGWLQAAY
jgi:hypothetical protein